MTTGFRYGLKALINPWRKEGSLRACGGMAYSPKKAFWMRSDESTSALLPSSATLQVCMT
jgi:hypothetical protein